MQTFKSAITSLAASLLVLSATQTRADELADKGRDIFQKNRLAVVTVQVVLKTKFSVSGMGGESTESKQDLTGTVIDPSGLTVLSLSSTDPATLFREMMGDMGDEEMNIQMDSELSDVKILLEDGTELPASVVLRDKDLDLAFIRPKSKPANPMQAVDLTKSSTAQILDQIVTLNRLGTAAGRAYSASVERVSAVIQKPRPFYIPDSSMSTTTLGSPAFKTDGTIVGIFVMRTVKTSGSGIFNLQPDGATAIILPAENILKAARQAEESAPESREKEDAKRSSESGGTK